MPLAEELGFGPFRLGVRQRTLSRDGAPVALPSRAFDVLLTLIEARAAPIGKDELMRRVWGAIVVEENNLHVQIAAIRRALGPEHPYILTIPARGYHFVGDVAEIRSPGPQPPRFDATGNLPVQVTDLVGRVGELDGAVALLERARLVTLVGPGGVGKTKLALAIARALTGRFEGGGWLLELGALADPALTASALAACLKVEEAPDRTLLESLLAALRPREMLLLIDGCEHVLAAAADLIAEILRRCPGIRFLCTSQAPLGVEGEHVRRLAPFEVGPALDVTTVAAAMNLDAVRLFAERAGAGDSRFSVTPTTLPGVIDICRKLEGIPLAIELAAARVPLLGLEPVRQRIANRLALLGDDRRDTPQRHRTLRATIEWSYGLLPQRARLILQRLSVFTGGFTLEAAQQVASGGGIAEWDVVRGVSDLVQRSMLTTGPDLIHPRHRMLEAVRAFALERLDEAGERVAVARRHADYFRLHAEAAEARWEAGGEAQASSLLTPELENLRAALEWTLGGAAPGLGAELAGATARFWFDAGHITEGRAWLSRALDVSPDDLDVRTRIKLQRGLGDLCVEAASAGRAAAAALALAEDLAEPGTLGACLRTAAAARYRMGDYGSAKALAERALTVLDEHRQPRSWAQCLADLGILAGVAGDYVEARRRNAQAQRRLLALGDRRGAAICLQYAAEFEFAAGHGEAAIQMADESVALFRALNARFHLEIGLANLAAYRLVAGDAAEALTPAREALALADEIADETGVTISLESLALALARLGDLEAAARLHGHVEAALARLGMTRQETETAVHEALLAALAELDGLAAMVADGADMDASAAMALALVDRPNTAFRTEGGEERQMVLSS